MSPSLYVKETINCRFRGFECLGIWVYMSHIVVVRKVGAKTE